MNDNTNIKLAYLPSDFNISLSGQLEKLNSTISKNINERVFCVNAYRIITNGLNSYHLKTLQMCINDDQFDTLVYIDNHDISNQYNNLFDNSYAKNFCENTFKILLKKNNIYKIPTYTSIIEFKYDDTNQIMNDAVLFVKNIINSIILQSNINTFYIINLSLEAFEDNNILGYAIWSSRTIVLNSNNSSISYLNSVSYPINNVVLLHEVLHILGLVGVGNPGVNFVNTTNNTYNGEKGVLQYKNLLSNNTNKHQLSLSDISSISVVPIEDDFGSGTAHSHFEEGINDSFNNETRIINNIHHPVLQNEICTGFLDYYNFLTPLTLGVLEDISYVVNYNSSYVVSSDNLMVFV